MNICVCLKQVEQTYARSGRDPGQYFLEPVDRIMRVNPYDEAAMLLAAKAAQRVAEAKIFLLTIGRVLQEDELLRILALGGDRLFQIEPDGEEADEGALDSWQKAQLLSQAVRALEGDLVLCGKESIDTQNGLVASYLAHLLQRPLVASIIDLSLATDAAHARMTKTAGKGVREIIECPLPAVLSVDPTPGLAVAPSLAAKQAASKVPVSRLVLDTPSLAPKTRRLGLSAPRPRAKPVPAPDSSLPSFERVRLLLSGSSIQKKGKMVFGPPETQVEEILQFLQTHDLGPAAARRKPSGE